MDDQKCCGDCDKCMKHDDRYGVKMNCCVDHDTCEKLLEKRKSELKSKTVKVKSSKR